MNINARRRKPLNETRDTRFGVLKKNLCDIFLSIRRTLHFTKLTQSVEERSWEGHAEDWDLLYNKTYPEEDGTSVIELCSPLRDSKADRALYS